MSWWDYDCWFYWIYQENQSSHKNISISECCYETMFLFALGIDFFVWMSVLFYAQTLNPIVITHLITEKITISAYCRLKTWKCWLITAGDSESRSGDWLRSGAQPALAAGVVTVSLGTKEDPGLALAGLTRQNWRQSRYAHLPPQLPRVLPSFCTSAEQLLTLCYYSASLFTEHFVMRMRIID